MKIEILTKNDNLEVQNSIISKIRDLINFKNLEPGEKLPSERMLSENSRSVEVMLERLFKNLSFMVY